MYGQLGDGTTANSLVPEQVFKLADTTTPPTGTMALNGGAAQTYASLVTLDSSGVRGADEMCTSVDGATWTAWRPYAASSVVALPGLPGAKTVHVRYRNADPTVLERTASVTLVATPIAAGAESSVALAADGSLWAWGWNRSGQLGDGTTTNQTSPEHVGGVGAWTAIAAGDEHTLALKADGSLWAWGDGTSSPATLPVTPAAVAPPPLV